MTRREVLAVRSSLYRGYVHARERANELERVYRMATQSGVSPSTRDDLARGVLQARTLEKAWGDSVIKLGNEAGGKWP
jgi:hypothetical protein